MEQSAVESLLMPAVYLQILMRQFPDPQRLLAGTRLPLPPAGFQAGRITVRDDLHCVANALAIGGQHDWYQEWAARIAEHFHGPLTPAWLSAPTLGDGLDLFARYFHCRIPYMEFRTRSEGGRMALEMRPLIELGALLPLLVEIPLLILQKYIRTIRHSRMAEAAVELNYEAPLRSGSYRRWFECETRFGCARNALLIPQSWRATPNLGYDEPAWRAALQKCEETSGREAPRYVVNRLRLRLHEAFDGTDPAASLPTLESMAAALHMSPRTLIRRLRGIGTTFHDERDELRKLRAHELVQAGELSVAEIAALLKFSDPPNFGKAFRRWFGASPSQYRADLRSLPR